jgi:glycine oxidase
MADVVVIGGGVMGLLAARELQGRGLAVTLVERDRPGRQASWASAGIISQTVKTAEDPFLALRARSAAGYAAFAQALREETGVDVGYIENGDLVPALSDEEASGLERETRRLAAEGHRVEFVAGAELRQIEPALSARVVAARLGAAAQVDPRRLCQGLERSCRLRGVEIHPGAAVTEIVSHGDRVEGVRTLLGDFRAPRVVVAAGSWSGRLRGAEPRLPIVPQRGQILALGRENVPLRRTVRKRDDPYLVPRPDGRLVVGATREEAGYEATVTARGVAWLLDEAMALVPGLADAPLLETWSGFRPLSLDGYPAIGPGALEGLYFLTGHGPTGIGPAPASVELLVALMLDEAPAVPAALFDPCRFGCPPSLPGDAGTVPASRGRAGSS